MRVVADGLKKNAKKIENYHFEPKYWQEAFPAQYFNMKIILANLFSGSRCRHSSTKLWNCEENVRLYGCPPDDEDGSPLECRSPPAPGPSQIPESAPERDGFRDSSSGGIVVVSSKQGTVPFSFSSSICGSGMSILVF